MSRGRIYCRGIDGQESHWGEGNAWVDFTVAGKRTRKRIEARTKSQAEIIMAQMIAEACKNAKIASPRLEAPKLAGAFMLWEDQEQRGPRDVAAVELAVEFLGSETALDEINRHDIARWAVDREKTKGLKPTTILRELTALSAFFTWATGSGLIETNPVRDVRKPSQRWTPREPVSREEMRLILDAVQGHAIEPVVVLAYFAGLRRSEIARVTRGCFSSQGFMVPGTKTKGSRAAIPILPGLAKYMKRHRWNGEYFCAQDDGEPYKANSLHQMVLRWNQQRKKMREAGEDDPPIHMPTLYQFRHSIGAHLIEDGHPVHVVAAFLRNSIKMVESVYGHYTGMTFEDSLKKFKG